MELLESTSYYFSDNPYNLVNTYIGVNGFAVAQTVVEI